MRLIIPATIEDIMNILHARTFVLKRFDHRPFARISPPIIEPSMGR